MEIAIGTTLISTILEPMAAKAMTMVVNKVCGIVHIKRDISRLQTTLRTIQSIVRVAEEKQIDDDFIRNWLRDLVDIAYEARDVLDDFITYSGITASKPVNFISSSDTSNIPLCRLNKLAKDIKCVRERFDEKIKEAENFKTLISVVGGGGSERVYIRVDRRPEVGPSTNKQSDYKFVEREEIKEGIMEKILHPEYDRVDVVAIWGMGGIGKTTLTQSIYNDERVKKVPRSWLFVGENKFSAEKVIREIINDKETIGIGNLETKLKEKLRGDKFLIVLDDLWDVDGSTWSLLFNPLTNVGKGGLIIITTRRREVCTATNTKTTYDLKPLSEEESWSIFESCAYLNGKSDSTPDLKGIGKEIVKKLNGHPLALKVVGCSLLDEDSSTWKSFLKSKLTKDDEVMSALKWSYNHLPPHLKMCFTYCALFPKDRVLDKKVLVEMWMAHDLIQINGDGRPEDIGSQYFKKLTYASLIQCVDERYVMHDLIHDLALHVSNEEFSSAVGSLSMDHMKKVRHITIPIDIEYSKNLSSCKSKRILTVYTPNKQSFEYCTLKKDILLQVFKHSKSLRVLVLSHPHIREIPDCISELKHLRYLDVSKTNVKSLPDSLCRLYNLQMIAAQWYVLLPRDVVNMVNLRYIRATLSTCKGVGKLTSLQELYSIHVCEGDNIRELGKMQRLRGKLTIKGHGVKRLGDEFYGTFTDSKVFFPSLESLEFSCMQEWEEWDDIKNSNVSFFPRLTELVIHGCPKLVSVLPIVKNPIMNVVNFMTSLSNLKISKCDGLKQLQLDALVSLKDLVIIKCPKFESLPPLGELTSLKHLSLEDVGVKRLGDEFYGKFTDGKVFFPSLESLSFSFMTEWEEWDDIIIENSNVSFFPRLTKLEIKYCRKPISVLPVVKNPIMNAANIMTSLSRLTIRDCDGLKRLQLDALASLKELEIIGCSKLESLPALGELTSLKRLSLERVGVKRLGDEFYRKFTDSKVLFPSLESLSFSFMKWEGWDDIIIENSSMSFFPTLTTLKLSYCPKLKSFAPHGGFDKLQTLELHACYKLESLPALGELTSLKHLSLDDVGVKRLGDEFYGKFTDGKVFFPSLESLSFYLLGKWEEWDDIIIENSSVSFFPRLTKLEIKNCAKLVSVLPVVKNPIMNAANFMTSLSHLEIWKCDGLKWLQLDALASLKELKIIDWSKLESLLALGELTSLKSLSLKSLGVKRLGDEFYGKFTDGKVFFPSLESLSFSCMQEWEEWDDIIIKNSNVSFFPRLTRLEFYNCPKLVSVLPVVKNPIMNATNFMTSLSSLNIRDCRNLQSLSADGLPPSLTYLKISYCPLLYERCKDESGLDWNKINHIRERKIYKYDMTDDFLWAS